MRSGTGSPIVSPIAAETSRPTRSSSASGPIGWPAPSRMHVSMPVGSMPGLFEQPHGVEEVGEQQPVDDEPGHVGHLDGGLLERAAQRQRARAGLRGGRGGKDQLDELHAGDGIEDVQPDEPLRAPALAGQPLDRQRRGGAREDRLGRSSSSSSGKQAGLDVVILDDRLDHELGLRERVAVGHDLHVLRVDLGAQAGEGLLDGLPGPVGRVLRAREQQHGSVVGGGGRQAAGDRAAADDRQALVERFGWLG